MTPESSTDESTRIDQILDQVERLYRTLTGSEPPPADGGIPSIPPEKNPGEYVEMQLERLNAALAQTAGVSPAPSWSPPLTVAESGRELLIHVDVPGVRREDVLLSATGRMLEISGTRQAVGVNGDFAGAVRHTERPYGTFRRAVLLPPDALTDQVSAQMDSGVLTIRVGRTQVAAVTTRHVPLT